MKVQDVILKAMAKKISWLDAAEIIGVCDRTMRRMRDGYEKFGYTGLMDRRRGKPNVRNSAAAFGSLRARRFRSPCTYAG